MGYSPIAHRLLSDELGAGLGCGSGDRKALIAYQAAIFIHTVAERLITFYAIRR